MKDEVDRICDGLDRVFGVELGRDVASVLVMLMRVDPYLGSRVIAGIHEGFSRSDNFGLRITKAFLYKIASGDVPEECKMSSQIVFASNRKVFEEAILVAA